MYTNAELARITGQAYTIVVNQLKLNNNYINILVNYLRRIKGYILTKRAPLDVVKGGQARLALYIQDRHLMLTIERSGILMSIGLNRDQCITLAQMITNSLPPPSGDGSNAQKKHRHLRTLPVSTGKGNSEAGPGTTGK